MPDLTKGAFKREAATPEVEEGKESENKIWESLQRAKILFAQGNYDGSLEENRNVLAWAEGAPPGDRALFNMGLIYANGANPKRNLGKSLAYFQRVFGEFPQSPLAGEAKVWATLLQRCFDLTKDVVDLTQENVALLQENAKMVQTLEKARQTEEPDHATKDLFLRVKKSFDQGTYEALLEESQKALSAPGKNAAKDRALFQSALIYGHAGNPKRDLEKSISFFQRLVKEYPQSPLAEESKAFMDMIQENLKLNRVIEQSKQVDIAIEEKKREKGR